MSTSTRIVSWCVYSTLLVGFLGCNLVPQSAMRQCSRRATQLYHEKELAATQRDQYSMSLQEMTAQKQQLENQTLAMQQSLDAANQRLANLKNERSELHQRYVSMLNQKNALSAGTTQQFQDLADKYPEFEFDPATGTSKFHSDILFASGSAKLKTSSKQLLQDFAKIMSSEEAQPLNILVVGHTDDKPIKRSATKAKHPTNWHLSTDRANSVVTALAQSGIREERMGSAGYGKFQPLVANKDEKSRQLNRRVEIFVLAPNAVVAGWEDAETSTN